MLKNIAIVLIVTVLIPSIKCCKHKVQTYEKEINHSKFS